MAAPDIQLVLVDGSLTIVDSSGADGRVVEIHHARAFAALIAAVAACRHGAYLDAVVEAAAAALGNDLDRAVEVVCWAGDLCLVRPAGRPLDAGSGPARTAVASPALSRYLAVRRARRYADYSAPTVLAEDAAQMRLLAATEPPPPVEPAHQGEHLRLPHPALSDPVDALSTLAHLLFYSAGMLRPARFLDTLDTQLRAVPSFGARHPFDLVLSIPDSRRDVAPSGRYGYLPSLHRLVRLGPAHRASGPVRIDVHAVYERVQWRYRHSIAYDMVLLDLGHLLAHIHAVAAHLGLALRAVRPETSGPTYLSHEAVAALVWEETR